MEKGVLSSLRRRSKRRPLDETTFGACIGTSRMPGGGRPSARGADTASTDRYSPGPRAADQFRSGIASSALSTRADASGRSCHKAGATGTSLERGAASRRLQGIARACALAPLRRQEVRHLLRVARGRRMAECAQAEARYRGVPALLHEGLLEEFGGSYWDRTSGPCRVKAVLYR